MSKSQTIKVFLTNIIVLSCLLGQDVSYPPPTTLVTMPTAGTLVRGSFSLEMRVQKGGGMSTALQVGITDRFQFGSSFGASNLIWDDSLRWYTRPEVNLKYRLIDETMSMPVFFNVLEMREPYDKARSNVDRLKTTLRKFVKDNSLTLIFCF